MNNLENRIDSKPSSTNRYNVSKKKDNKRFFTVDGTVVDDPKEFIFGRNDPKAITTFTVREKELIFDKELNRDVEKFNLFPIISDNELAVKTLKLLKGQKVSVQIKADPKTVEMNGINYISCNFLLKSYEEITSKTKTPIN
jgi:hypothetical protein